MKFNIINLLKSRYGKFCVNSHMNKVSNFYIDIPQLLSGYQDNIISKYLQKILSNDHFIKIGSDCQKFATKMENEWYHLHKDCETNQPYLERYDSWGRRTDQIITCEAWKKLKQISCIEGLIAIPFENDSAQYSRIHQSVKLMLFAPLSGLYSCPLAMTDGAAFVIERLGRPQSVAHAFQQLTSRDPNSFWTSGQWMTEKKGGSDVAAATDTIAVLDNEAGCYRLYGCKWFCSATDADMAFTLARSLDTKGNPVQGNKGLSLYYIETKSKEDNSPNQWNNLSIVALKDKLGTRQLPTAELLLNGSKAIKMSADGRGVSSISGMLLITRIHNAIAAVSAMRRITMLAVDYARRREAFGSTLIEKPLHASTLASMDIESRAAFYMLMDVVGLLGLQENKMASEEDSAVIRILSPLLKLYTAKQAMSVVSEGLESFGGQGFIEGTGLPGMLRDAQVLPIWEGTTNVLSLDALRSLNMAHNPTGRRSGQFHFFISRCQRKLEASAKDRYAEEREKLSNSLDVIDQFLSANATDPDSLQVHARDLSYSMSRVYMGVLLLENASSASSDPSDRVSVQYWMKKDLTFGLGDTSLNNAKIDWTAFFD